MWKLDRLGRSMVHLVNTVQGLAARGVGLKVLTGQGAAIDTTTAPGKPGLRGFFAALAEFERDLIRERTKAGLTAAAARGRKGGRQAGRHRRQATAGAGAHRKRAERPRGRHAA